MTRLEMYKYLKKRKKMILLVGMGCIITVIIGFFVVDYNINSMLFADNSTRIAGIMKSDELVYRVSFMDMESEVNFNYIREDIKKLIERMKDYYRKIISYVL